MNSFIVNGWKVARHIPKWIHSYKSWNDFINKNCSGEKGEENDYEEDDNDNMTKRITITKRRGRGRGQGRGGGGGGEG